MFTISKRFNTAPKHQWELALKLLQRNKGRWVSSYDLHVYARTLHHASVVKHLRKKGYIIENKIEYVRGMKRGFYRLLNCPVKA